MTSDHRWLRNHLELLLVETRPNPLQDDMPCAPSESTWKAAREYLKYWDIQNPKETP